MRALTISAHGGLEQLQYGERVPGAVAPGPVEVRLRVGAAALNHLDLFVVAGLPGVTITPPWTMGADAVGTVESAGSKVRDVREGDRVLVNPGISCRECAYCLSGEHPLCVRFALLGEHRPGTLAEFVTVPATNVRTIGGSVPDETAAGFTLATLTAWRMLVTRAALREGERVLIWGIGGGVALACLQIAKLLGAEVWVTSGSAEKLERATALGADHVVQHGTADVAREIRAATSKQGVDVVVDSVGASTWAQSLGSLGRRGRLVTCGATSGPIVETDVRRLFWNQWSILGSTMGNDREFDAIVEHFRDGRLLPPVDSVHALANGRAAFERLASGQQFGKIVVRVAEHAQ